MFVGMIAAKLGVPEANVLIFTVMNHPTMSRTTDIRFAAHGSPFYRPARLDGIVNQDKAYVSILYIIFFYKIECFIVVYYSDPIYV